MARRARRKKLPQEPVEIQIESLSHEGRGVAHLNGKTVFVNHALAGETVRFKYTAQHRRFDEGDTQEVLQASPLRVEPLCEHFGYCGGCQLQHLDSQAQIDMKQAMLIEQLAHLGKVEADEILPPLTSITQGYRHKARLGARYVIKKEQTLVGFRERRSHFIADLNHCPILHSSVGKRLQDLRTLITSLTLKDQIAQIEVAVGDGHTALVLRNLKPLGGQDQRLLIDFAKQTGLHIYLQPAGADSVHPLYPIPAVPLTYRIEVEDITVQFEPLDFTQVNPSINAKMIQRALDLLDLSPEDNVLELFCGLGNFTLPLAKHASHITAVEGDAGLIKRAHANATRNDLDNIQYQVANLMDEKLDEPWLGQSYPKILLDPPRSGAIEIINKLDFNQTNTIVYVSCNPATLARDAGILVNEKGFRLVKAGVMDMFPHTAHVESIALFVKK